MSDPNDLEGHDAEEQESRALLPALRDQQRVHAADRTYGQPSGHQQPEDLSALNERDIWRHFESTKRSAIFHLDQYLHHREIVMQGGGAEESASLDLISQNDAQVPRSLWDFKTARDNLLNELDLLNGLLDHMSSKSSKGLATFYGIIVILAVAVKLIEHGRSTGAKVAWGSLIAATGITAGYTLYRTAWFGSISLCQPVIKRIYERALGNELDETDRDDLKSPKFELLWWTSYFSTSKR
ncbi:hypothetical protein BDZ45DRAFT_681613 [Acephala macrosclerotiorum]|nr:hypothetical protein BDZ45DRAFT_681613 [Acephala macrosclerotiorum]